MSVESQPIGNTQDQESIARNKQLFKIALGIYRDFASRKLDVPFDHIFAAVREVGQDSTVLNIVGVIAERQIRESLTQQGQLGSNGTASSALSEIPNPSHPPFSPDKTSPEPSARIDKPDTIPRVLKQARKITNKRFKPKYTLEQFREPIARILVYSWNENIGDAHEKCTLEDAVEALKAVEMQSIQYGGKLKPFLYELIGSGELRSMIIERERKKYTKSLTGIYYSWFRLPELPDLNTYIPSASSKLNKIAKSGFKLPELPDTQPVSNSNSEMASPAGEEIILYQSAINLYKTKVR